jgi:peptide/nickel transport system ATP-binding protein
MMSVIAEAKNLKAYYITQAYGVERTVQAVDDISVQIKQGEVFGIAGESGCGKSTLLKVLLGVHRSPLTVVGGSVTYDFDGQEVDVLTLPNTGNQGIRWRKVSYIPQGSMHVLNPVRRIRDTFYDFISAHKQVSKQESINMTRSYLNELGLPEKVLAAYPHQLSGGMRQRVTIALATILWPRLIFADEPTTALDVVVQRGVIELLKEVQAREQSTLVLVTHDMGVHANLANRVAVLYAGKLVEEADTNTIFKNPRHPYTRYLINSLPKLDDRSERASIPGRPPALDQPPTGCRFHPRCPHVMDICREKEPPLITVDKHGDTEHRVACFLETEESA